MRGAKNKKRFIDSFITLVEAVCILHDHNIGQEIIEFKHKALS